MSQKKSPLIKHLESLRLPDLQKRYATATSKTSRSPNRKFLITAILEAEEKRAKPKPVASTPKRRAGGPPHPVSAAPRPPAKPEPTQKPASLPRGRFSKLTVPELLAQYQEVIGRPTGSTDRGYLIWKLREAQKGKISIGPSKRKVLIDPKTIPLRLESELVSELDEAWRLLGFANRTDCVKESLAFYLDHCRVNGRSVRPSETAAHA